MIRYAAYRDETVLKQLLKEVFGDNDRFIELFFRLKFTGDNVCLYEHEGVPVSMAFLLPATLLLEEGERSATYLYACATKETFRGRGYMKAIMERVYEDICAQRQAALFLMPAEESLYDYYGRCGFEPYFCWSRRRYALRHFSWRNDHEEYGLHKIDAACYADCRRRWLTATGTVYWDLPHLQVLEEEAVDSGNGFYAVTAGGELKACCLIWQRGDTCEVEEWIGEELPFVQGLFFRTFDADHVVMTCQGTDEKSALVRFAPPYQNRPRVPGYFNIAIN